MSTTSLDTIRSQLSALHFAKESLRPHELQTLLIAEELLRRVDEVLEIHAKAQYEGMGYEPDNGGSYGNMSSVCSECGTADEYGAIWPCDTVKALRGDS